MGEVLMQPMGGGVGSDDVTAAKAQVLTGYNTVTTDSDDEVVAGTMPNNAAWSASTSGSGSVTIPAGYHNGSGTVSGSASYSQGVSDADGRVNTSSASYSQGVSDAYNAVKVETFSETQMGGANDSKTHAISLSKTYTVPGTVIAAGVTQFKVKNGVGTKARDPKMSLSYSGSQVSLSASINSVDYGGVSVDGIIVYR